MAERPRFVAACSITLTVAMILASSPALAAKPPSQGVLASSPSRSAIRSLILKDLGSRRSLSFQPMLRRWESEYGTRAVPALLQIAGDAKIPEPQRYIALMGTAKLGGSAVAPSILPFLRDPAWMIRSGALRAMTALKNPRTSEAVLPLLRDRALVVRMEAIEAVEKLRPRGSAAALASILDLPENYHGRKAQWVPQRALAALKYLQARDTAPKLRPLLDRTHDEDLARRTIETLESLTGKRLAPGRPLSEQTRAWKNYLK